MSVERFAGESAYKILASLGIPPEVARWIDQNVHQPAARGERTGRDPRDYRTEPYLWRSDLLPLGISIDQAILDGVW